MGKRVDSINNNFAIFYHKVLITTFQSYFEWVHEAKDTSFLNFCKLWKMP